MNKKAPIGVIDSGVGGLTTVAQLSKLLPGEDIIFCGDNGNAPYGNRSGEEIVELTTHMLDFLADQGVKLVAVACNTISATFDTPGLAGYEKKYDFPVLSIIRAAADDVVSIGYSRVGVIATAFTIASGQYPALIEARDSNIEVFGEPSANLARLIEQGDLSSEAIQDDVQHHLSNLLGAHPEVKDIVLGCTHYPIVLGTFQRYAPSIAFINPAEAQARAVQKLLGDADGLQEVSGNSVGSLKIHTSGGPAVYETVLSELQVTRKYQLEQIDFSAGGASQS